MPGLVERLSRAVWGGGPLIVVGRDLSDLYAGAGRPDLPRLMLTTQGRELTVRDAVVRAQRST